MKTRAKPKAEGNETESSATKRELPSSDSNAPRLLILDRKICSDASIMTLSHPRTRAPTRYYVCPDSGIYELRKTASATSPSSWLLQTNESSVLNALKANVEVDADSKTPIAQGYISRASDVFTATTFDPFFLMLPALEKQSPYHGERTNKQLLCMDDLLEDLFENSKHFKHLMDSPLAKILENRLAAVCQMVEVDERMYRLDHEKIFQELLSKAQKMSKLGLPPSMEDKFVTRALEKPAFASALAAAPAEQSVGIAETERESEEDGGSQSASTSSSTSNSQNSAETGLTTPDSGKQVSVEFNKVKELQRVRVAYSFILASYFSPKWEKHLLSRLNEQDTPLDFTPLDEYLADIARMKEEALAARSITDFSRKRGIEDDEVAAERAEKRKKLDEEEKRRKANESRGVRDLKKVNVSGMKKMSDFFKKAPGKA
jgi:Ydr279p protein family (RNase H2 complex component) wHTH domain/Ydr279p protein triple barrel domain